MYMSRATIRKSPLSYNLRIDTEDKGLRDELKKSLLINQKRKKVNNKKANNK